MKTPSTRTKSTLKVETNTERKLQSIAEQNQHQLQTIFQNAPAAIAVFEGPEHRYILANKTYEKLFNRQAKVLLGKSIHEVFPELEGTGAFELVDHVYETGEAFSSPEHAFVIDTHNDGVLRHGYFNFSMEPLKNDSGEIYAVIAMTYDITEQVELRKKIEESEKQKGFLLKLSDALRLLSAPQQIKIKAMQVLGEHLNVSRCYYAEVIRDGKYCVIDNSFSSGLGAIDGTYRLEDFGKAKVDVLQRGEIIVTTDVAKDTSVTQEERSRNLEMQIHAYINVPLVKDNKLICLLGVNQSEVRHWTALELTCVQETAERTWAAVERAKAEEALTTSEVKFRTLFNSIDQGFTLCELIRNKEGKGVDLCILEVNPTYEKQTGVIKEMVVGKPLLKVFPSLDKWIGTYAAVVDNHRPVVFEHFFEDTDRWFAIKAYPLEKDRFAVLFSDITERKQVEEAIAKREQEIREIKEQLDLSIRAGKIGVWFWDVKKDILTWSNEQKAIYGFNASDIISNAAQFNCLIVPEDLKRIQDDQMANIGLDHEYDFRINRKNDGELRWIKSRARNTLDPQGALQSICGVNIDVTEQVMALNEIRQSEERFRTLAETLPQMVWVMNGEGAMEFGSKNWQEYSGFDDVGQAWNYMMHPDDRERLTAYWGQVFAQGKGYKHEVRLKNKEGVYRWFYSVGEPVLDADKKVSKWVGSLTDIHEQKNIEEMLEKEVAIRTMQLAQKNTELQNMNKELEAFTYISSHDLQEPLRKMQTFAGRIIATERDNLSETGKDYLLRMHNESERMSILIQDLLSFSSLTNAEMKFEMTDLSKIIEELKADFKEVISEVNATIITRDLGEVKIIPFQFRQLMHNLITNALKFAKPNTPPMIIIKCEIISAPNSPFGDKGACHITVSDNGIGFEQQFSEKIFQVFQRLHNKEEYAGTGIGLAIVKKIVDIHHGIITAEGNPGKGATFNIYLPLE